MDMMIDFTKCNEEGLIYLLGAYFGHDQTIPEGALASVSDYVWSPAEVKQKCKESRTVEEAIQVLLVPPDQ